LKVTYFGHSAFLVEGGGTRLIIDPFLTGQGNAPVQSSEIKVSYIIVTHAHGDHIGDAVEIAKVNDATIIANHEVGNLCETKGCKTHRMHIGGSHNFDFGRVKLTIAHHGSSHVTEEGIQCGGVPCGILLTMDGKTLYHSGDTGLFLDMKLIGEIDSIDLALLPIGDNFTMGIDDAVKAVEFLNPKLAIPMHYNTFPVIEADPNEFVKKVKAIGKKAKVLGYGEKIEV